MRTSRGHEKWDVYQTALEFITWTLPLLESLSINAPGRIQLHPASTSIPLNFARAMATQLTSCYLDNARGSAPNPSAGLDVVVAKRFAKADGVSARKELVVKMVSMLFGMIRANSDIRLFETPSDYCEKKNRNRITNWSKKDSR
jgi:hypothetical protein